MTEHNWTSWELYVTCLLLAKNVSDSEDGGDVSYADEALQSDADRLFDYFNSGKPSEIDNRMQVYGMIDKGTVEERIEATAELYAFIQKKTGN